MNANEFITNPRMHSWSKDDRTIYPLLSFEVNPDVTEEDKQIKVGIYLVNAEFDFALAREVLGREIPRGTAGGFYLCLNKPALNTVSLAISDIGVGGGTV
ncbi:hypothetical protein, partial [Serratia sp. DD3]|uniref:hypothetical protein n=1 Tax=Serratia sp. DD3 TaxID=1410619 RepID=UPI000561AE01